MNREKRGFVAIIIHIIDFIAEDLDICMLLDIIKMNNMDFYEI